MKKTTLFKLFFLLLVIGCTPDSEEIFDEDNKPTQNQFTYTATINNIDWKGTVNISALVKDAAASPPKRLDINAQSANGQRLLLSLKDGSNGVSGNGIAIRAYILSATKNEVTFSYEINGNNTYEGTLGTVNVTSCDAAKQKVSGVFTCTLYNQQGDSIKVTQGVIKDLPYTIFE